MRLRVSVCADRRDRARFVRGVTLYHVCSYQHLKRATGELIEPRGLDKVMIDDVEDFCD